MNIEGRLPRIKGSGDHNWEPWSQATLGRGRICQDCGCEDDGYQQPCRKLSPPMQVTIVEQDAQQEMRNRYFENEVRRGHIRRDRS